MPVFNGDILELIRMGKWTSRTGVSVVHLLFVCTGNTCRSPMAAFFARARIVEQGLPWTVDSAGLYAAPGMPMTALAADALIRRHVAIGEHQSKPLTQDLVDQADIILTMTASHKSELLARFPQADGKVQELGRYLHKSDEEPGGQYDIVDPFGGTDAHYDDCAEAIDRAVQNLLHELSRTEGDSAEESEGQGSLE